MRAELLKSIADAGALATHHQAEVNRIAETLDELKRLAESGVVRCCKPRGAQRNRVFQDALATYREEMHDNSAWTEPPAVDGANAERAVALVQLPA